MFFEHRGGSTQATILPSCITLTKAHRAAISMMAKGCIVALVQPLRCFLFLPANHIHIYPIITNIVHILTRGEYCNSQDPLSSVLVVEKLQHLHRQPCAFGVGMYKG